MSVLSRGQDLVIGKSREQGAAFALLFPLLLAAYMLFGRPFAWLHIPGTPLFIGEIVLAFGLVGMGRALTWDAVWTRSSVPFVMSLYMAWGFTRLLPGLFDDPVLAVRDGVIWIYGFIAWAVIGALAQRPWLLERWLRGYMAVIPFAVLWLPFAVYLSSLEVGTIPGSDVSITAFNAGAGQVHLVMTIAFLWLVWQPRTLPEVRWRAIMSGLAVAGVLVMSTRNRGGFVAATASMSMLLLFYPNRTRLVLVIGRALLILAVITVILDPRIDIGEREISLSQLTSNVTSLVTMEGDGGLGGNISWRTSHWADILEGVNREVPFAGHGFGPNIAEIYDIPQTDIGLRNAHNTHLTVLARSGWVGFGLWLSLWAVWFFEVNGARRRLRSSGFTALSGLAAMTLLGAVGLHVEAIFNPSIEGPPAAFWVWTLLAVGLFVSVASSPVRGRRRPLPITDLRALDLGLANMSRRRPRR